ncbi:putative GPI anchor-containing protein [Cryptosporidium canis]|nr:putative GPI anchor-containing protein [Cryptosporidium canis]
MSNFGIEEECRSSGNKMVDGGSGKPGSSCFLKIMVPRSMIIFISALTGLSIIALAFHAIPMAAENYSLMYQKRGNPIRFDHRISSILKPSLNIEPNSLRGGSSSPYDQMKLEFLRKGIPEHVQQLISPRMLAEETAIDTNSSVYNPEGKSPLSGMLTLGSNSTVSSPEEGEVSSDQTPSYTCHKIVSLTSNSSANETDAHVAEENCKTYFVSAGPIPEQLRDSDLATINAYKHLNEAFQSVKMAAEILEGRPKDEGLLVTMATKMNYQSDWKSSLEKIYANWEYSTFVSQIILTSWTISKSFFAGSHYAPALDFGFMVLNIPPEGKDEYSATTKQSLDVVKSFVSNLGEILDSTMAKLLEGPNYSIISENRLTENLFTNWNYTDDSFSYISSYFNKNQSMLLEHYLTSAALDVSRLVEKLPLTIVDSMILAKDNFERLYKEDRSELRLTNPNETQVVVIPPVERKRIARYDYEEKFRRVCIYQAHTEQKSILRSTPSRASMAEYARYHGYSYFLFDGSFYDSIPRSMFTDWSKQGYYMKLFSGLRLLFWDLDKVADVLGKVIKDPYSNVMSEELYSKLLEDVVPDNPNIDWDMLHNGKLGRTGEINPKGTSGREGIQMTPSNMKVDICDYVVWFDLDIAITNKFFSIERVLDSNTPESPNAPPEMFKKVLKDVGDISIFTTRDSEWRSRNSLVNSGFLIVSRSRYSLQSLFHAIALNPIDSQEIVRNGRFWPEQSTLTHAVVNIFNHSYGSPNQTYEFLDSPIATVDDVKVKLVGTTPIAFTAYSNETGRYTHSIITSQRVANGFLQINPDIYGEGPWAPGDLFIHAAGQKSPFRDNVLSGMLYSIHTIGFSPNEVEFYKNNCYVSLDFVYQGLDRLIDHLSHEFSEFDKAKSNDLSNKLQRFNNVDLTFNFIGRLMAVKTKANANDTSVYSDNANYEKVHFLRCSYTLAMSTKWSIAEAFALGGISVLGVTVIAIIFKLAKMKSGKGVLQNAPDSQN